MDARAAVLPVCDGGRDGSFGGPRKSIRRIATEEAFTTSELAEAWLAIARQAPVANLDLILMKRIYEPGAPAERVKRLLLDFGERLRAMDETGVDMHVLSVTIPGVQMFDAERAVEHARRANDRLAEIVRGHPDRFAGLACFAPQSPVRAAAEMERAVKTLGLNGFIVNSHTHDEYLDAPKFWPIFEAAERLDRPIYLHPRAPSDGMAGPFRQYNLDGALWGYGIEAGTHAVRLILSGLFDRFPRLRIVLGHMGEAVPFWLWRLDHMQARREQEGRAKRLQLAPSDYFRRNFAITASGMESHDVLDFVLKSVGEDNVMWAIDYPYEASASAVAFMDSAPVGEATLAKLYHRNAERIFHIASG